MRAQADEKAGHTISGTLGAQGRRALTRSSRAANQSPPARLPEDAVPHDPWTEAAALATLLGIDPAKVREAIDLSGGEAADWSDDVL